MTTTIKGHFDGRVIVPDSPVDLPRNEQLIIHIETEPVPENPAHGTVGYLIKHLVPMSDEDAAEMRQAIEEAHKNAIPSPDVDFD